MDLWREHYDYSPGSTAGNPVVRTVQVTPAKPGIIPPRRDRVLLVFWACNGQFSLFPDSQDVSDLVGYPFEALGPSTGLGTLPLVISDQMWEGAAGLGWTLTSAGNTGVTLIEQYVRQAEPPKRRSVSTITLKIR